MKIALWLDLSFLLATNEILGKYIVGCCILKMEKIAEFIFFDLTKTFHLSRTIGRRRC
jgi:hypothetical protein